MGFQIPQTTPVASVPSASTVSSSTIVSSSTSVSSFTGVPSATSVPSAVFNQTNNVAVYWGQNSYGQGTGSLAQQPLAYYCANTNIDIIPMAFLLQLTTGQGGQPVLNFANQENNCTIFPGTQLINCPQIGEDIKTCQQTYKKTILLSIGGATYTEGGFASSSAAVSAANLVWNAFGPVTTSTSQPATSQTNSIATLRPFGDAVIDGFDFDFETAVQNTVPFANELRRLMGTDKSKPYYLTAAPQCPYPDYADNPMLNGGVQFDAVFVQYYNNYCGVQSYVPGAQNQWNFNFETWDNWAKTGSANPNVKIFLGVPAGPTAAGSGYTSVAGLGPVLKYIQTFSSFGGIMMWDASQAYANTGFLAGIKSALTSKTTRRSRVQRDVQGTWEH